MCQELPDYLHQVLLGHHSRDQIQRSQTNAVVTIIQTLHNQVPGRTNGLEQTKKPAAYSLVLTQQLWLSLQYLGHRQEAEVLEVLVGVLDEEVEFGDAELHGGGVMVEASDHCADTLVEQRHGRGAVDEVGKGLHQLLPKPRLQWSEGAKLMDIRKRV